jgi:glucose-1-phosphate thymidylyltransferase
MQAVVLAGGEGTRLRPLTADRPKGMVEVAGLPVLTHCFAHLAALGVDSLVVVVGHREGRVIDHYGDEFPVTYAHQREQRGLAHALPTAEPYVDDDFVVMLGDNVLQANLAAVLRRQRETDTDAAFLVEEVSESAASRYGVCVTNDDGEIIDVVERPADPPSRLVMTGFYTFSPAIFDACRLVQPSDRGEYELTDAIHLLIESGRCIDANRMDGWRVDVGYPEDRDRAEQRLLGRLDAD